MKFRPARGTLAESLERLEELPSTIEALTKHLSMVLDFGFDLDKIGVVSYTQHLDKATMWSKTYAVKLGDNIVGWVDSGPLEWEREAKQRSGFERHLPQLLNMEDIDFSRNDNGNYRLPWLRWAFAGYQAAYLR
jgi:hypothetical protein